MLRRPYQVLWLGIACAVLAWGASRLGWLDAVENATWSSRVRHLARAPAEERIAIVLLDQASLDWGAEVNAWQWPWPRTVQGYLLDFLRRGSPRGVAFDVLFTEPNTLIEGDDDYLAAAVASATGFVGALYLGRETSQHSQWPEYAVRPRAWLEGLEAWLTPERERRLRADGAAFPIRPLAEVARVFGTVNDVPDRDGVFRRAALFTLFDGVPVPSLGLALYLAAHPDSTFALEEGRLRAGKASIPVDGLGRVILRYRRGLDRYPVYSAAALLQSEANLQAGEKPQVDPAEFNGKYVLYGFSAPGLKDLRPTPVDGNYPGVGIHATLLDNLLEREAMADAPRGWVWVFGLALALAGAAGTRYSRTAWQSVVAMALLIPIPLAAGAAGYVLGVWWPVPEGLAGLGLALGGGVIINYATEGRQKRFIKSAFKQYLGEAVIDQIIADPSRLALGGEKKELTMFFSDLEKFSSFSEKLEPAQLIELLNAYLSDMGAVIMEEGGYLDKYIGDAIVAFWNAPLAQGDHALRAVRAALRCQRRLAERQAELSAMAAGMPVRMRVGLNTGDVVVGNMGSSARFNYTMLGDAANLASRLEGANKAFGTYLLVAESTWRLLQGAVPGRELGRLQVVGRRQPVRVFEPLALPGESAPAWLPVWEQAMACVARADWSGAAERFAALDTDPAAQRWQRRCAEAALPGAPVWDGVWSLTEK